jgi:ribosome-binding protein aMBF1 (putative translation factor)
MNGRFFLVSKTLGARILNARTARGITREQLAVAINKTASDITRIETGNSLLNQPLLNRINRTLKTEIKRSY